MRLLLLAAAFLAVPAQAQTELASFSGSTIGAPTYSNDIASEDDVPYRTFTLVTDTDGEYVIESGTNYDGALSLYLGSFNPEDSEENLISYSDDCETARTFGFGSAAPSGVPCAGDSFDEVGPEPLVLTAGQTYVVVQGAYDQEKGNYRGAVFGPSGATVTLGEGAVIEFDLVVDPLDTTIPTTGGKARFYVAVVNNTDERIDGGVVVLVNGEARRVLASRLAPNSSQSFGLNLSFPARVPDGIYEVTLLAVSGEEVLGVAGPLDVVVGDTPIRLAHPSAVAAALKARAKAGDKSARVELDAFRAARKAAALLVGVEGTSGRRVLDASSTATE